MTRGGLDKNCNCKDGYFENSNVDCAICVAPCKYCTASDVCVSCISSTGRDPAPSCACSAGYYDDGSGNCSPCHYKCLTCSGTFDTCTVCKT